MLIDVVQVEAHADFSLVLQFENGEKRRFEMRPYIDQKPWVRLKSGNAFLGAFVKNGTVAWSGNIDIDPETLHELSIPIYGENVNQYSLREQRVTYVNPFASVAEGP
ncbi:hypothetical protein CCP3SC15_3150003 [Gammaproteobacteria bacterium]